MRFVVNEAKTPALVYGVTTGNAHAPDEYTYVEDIIIATKVYALTAFDLLA
jgi:acetylornithine deacetylase/succinyl-diaminopimelate desuccinylase-like protein